MHCQTQKCLTDVLMPPLKTPRHMGHTDALRSPQHMGNIWDGVTYIYTGGYRGHMYVWGISDVWGHMDSLYADNPPHACL